MLLGWIVARAAMHEYAAALTELESTRVHFGVTQQGWQQLLWGIGAVVGASNQKGYSCGIDVWLLHEDKGELCDRTSRTLRSGKTPVPAYKATHRGYP